ncbi:TIM barrel protein [Candidatus Pacearchaeota archaeon]|nr:TIM barrel protein [Candidatus Pacearchaeota archaeon]
MTIVFGPGGLGGVKEAVSNLERYYEMGIKACEIEFTYGVYIKENQAEEIKKAAERLGIKLSIHGHYWINLNSEDAKKIEQSKKRILDCCKIGHLLGVREIVFHPGFYGKKEKEETYQVIKKAMLELQEEIKKNKWKVVLCPETTGKVNVFGSVDEILRLVKDTKCSFTLDFAHLLARSNGKMSYEEMLKQFENLGFKEIHCHFSGIVYGDKGEKHHIMTPKAELVKLLNVLKKSKINFKIINESPDPVRDAAMSVKVWDGMNGK